MREFKSGATRDDDENKYDYEGFLSPLVLERYAKYMHKHRKQADGKMRDSDNWQKGIPVVQYMKSKLRHIMRTWKLHRFELAIKDYEPHDYQDEIEESLCAELFNTMGMLDVILRGQCHEEKPEKTRLETQEVCGCKPGQMCNSLQHRIKEPEYSRATTSVLGTPV